MSLNVTMLKKRTKDCATGVLKREKLGIMIGKTCWGICYDFFMVREKTIMFFCVFTCVTIPSLFLSKAFMKKSEDLRIFMKVPLVRVPLLPASRMTLE